MPFKIGYVLDL